MTETRNTKQQAGERELAALLYELTGHRPDALPGWSLTRKRYAVTPLALIAGEWWPEAVEKARREGNMPLLLYRRLAHRVARCAACGAHRDARCDQLRSDADG